MSTSNHPNVEYAPLVMMEKTVKWKPHKIELAPNCPRCSSSNTKFCYYNNYSVSQPRYFCKACRRYWTKGGSLRNVPIGGGCRKIRRGRPARSPSVESKNESDRGGDIDIDTSVFAQNYESSNLASFDDVRMQDGAVFEGGESAAGDQFRQVRECINGQDFVYQNFDGFEVEGMFGGELWSEDVQGFGSQPPLTQLQEFEVFSSDDQLRMSENLVCTDNWSSFDLSSYEDF